MKEKINGGSAILFILILVHLLGVFVLGLLFDSDISLDVGKHLFLMISLGVIMELTSGWNFASQNFSLFPFFAIMEKVWKI